MNQTLSRIFTILLVSVTATTCVLIPEITGGYPSAILIGVYATLLIVSLLARQSDVALLLIFCALALPVSEVVWAGYYNSWNVAGMVEEAQKHMLSFSFVGMTSYAIICIFAPFAIFFIGQSIRNHRKNTSA